MVQNDRFDLVHSFFNFPLFSIITIGYNFFQFFDGPSLIKLDVGNRLLVDFVVDFSEHFIHASVFSMEAFPYFLFFHFPLAVML
jgi:hypothetical protein